jgi:hypothetical protein
MHTTRSVAGFILCAAFLAASHGPVQAQVAVYDAPAHATQVSGFANQLAKTTAEIAKLQQQYVTAQNHLNQAIQNSTGLNQTQWAQLRAQFKVVLGAPAFINTTVAQQKAVLSQFQHIFPGYTNGANFMSLGQTLANNTQGAAQSAINQGTSEIAAIAGEKASLDAITNYTPKSEQEQLNLMATLSRQAIEQMEKMRVLLASQTSNMGVYYGQQAATAQATAAHQQYVDQQACLTAQTAQVLAQARMMNPQITEAQVTNYLAAHPTTTCVAK